METYHLRCGLEKYGKVGRGQGSGVRGQGSVVSGQWSVVSRQSSGVRAFGVRWDEPIGDLWSEV